LNTGGSIRRIFVREFDSLVVYSVLKSKVPAANDIRPAAFAFNRLAGFSYADLSVGSLGSTSRIRESGRKYGGREKPIMAETILHRAWRNAGLERASVRGRDGHTYHIVYGGKPGGSLGPDFTDAVVERDDGIVFRGDIEIHVRESDWRAHGHHTDPRYNGVVLHVVASDHADLVTNPALKSTGSKIPLLALNWKAAGNRPNHPDPPTQSKSPGKEKVALPQENVPLALWGLERFHSQAAGIALDIEAFGADQAIWLGILGALGYPRNKRAFRTVAQRVNWGLVSQCDSSENIEPLLLAGAGLNRKLACTTDKSILTSQLHGNPPEWVRPWGRPANSPVTRIKAISMLVPVWSGSSENSSLANMCEQAVVAAVKAKDLSSVFRPTEFVNDVDTPVLGKDRAAEIVVNVLLPAVFAIATRGNAIQPPNVHLKNRAIELFSSHPKLAENSVTREAKTALEVDYLLPKITNARDQQGLITLYREMFRNGIQPRQPRLPGV
jgi:hypothetical protein